MFRVKICGVTNPADIQLAAAAGADAIGLNFFPQSKRFLPVDEAVVFCRQWPGKVQRVGVFVNASVAEMQDVAERVQLDWIQLHGDEPLTVIEQLAPRPVIRAVRWKDQSVATLVSEFNDCGAAAVLVDAYQPQAYGGTGHQVNWDRARELAELLSLPMVLAGGLRPDNVQQAVSAVRPAAVDTASGVERQPGQKDADLTKAFVAAAQLAFRSSQP